MTKYDVNTNNKIAIYEYLMATNKMILFVLYIKIE